MNEKQLASALERAQQLMNNSSFNRMVESKSKNVNFTSNGDVINEKIDNLTHSEFIEEFSKIKNKGISQDILESFKRTPPHEIASSPMDYVMENVKTKQINSGGIINENTKNLTIFN